CSVLFSRRPCPLVVSLACWQSAASNACCRGGKSRGRRESGLDVSDQRGLVVLGGQHVIAAAFEHGLAKITMGEHGIARDYPTFQRHLPQQIEGRLVLLAFVAD